MNLNNLGMLTAADNPKVVPCQEPFCQKKPSHMFHREPKVYRTPIDEKPVASLEELLSKVTAVLKKECGKDVKTRNPKALASAPRCNRRGFTYALAERPSKRPRLSQGGQGRGPPSNFSESCSPDPAIVTVPPYNIGKQTTGESSTDKPSRQFIYDFLDRTFPLQSAKENKSSVPTGFLMKLVMDNRSQSFKQHFEQIMKHLIDIKTCTVDEYHLATKLFKLKTQLCDIKKTYRYFFRQTHSQAWNSFVVAMNEPFQLRVRKGDNPACKIGAPVSSRIMFKRKECASWCEECWSTQVLYESELEEVLELKSELKKSEKELWKVYTENEWLKKKVEEAERLRKEKQKRLQKEEQERPR